MKKAFSHRDSHPRFSSNIHNPKSIHSAPQLSQNFANRIFCSAFSARVLAEKFTKFFWVKQIVPVEKFGGSLKFHRIQWLSDSPLPHSFSLADVSRDPNSAFPQKNTYGQPTALEYSLYKHNSRSCCSFFSHAGFGPNLCIIFSAQLLKRLCSQQSSRGNQVDVAWASVEYKVSLD